MELKELLSGLKIKADIEKVETNGTTTKIYLKLHPGARVCRIENCATEIALGTKAYNRPIIRVIPEEGLVCIELLNNKIKYVSLSEFDYLFEDNKIKEYGELPIILGKQHDGKELIVDLAQMPHLLVAGSTGSGKSALLHSIICSLIKLDNGTRLALIDPKQVEFDIYKDVKQLLYPVVNSPDEALEVLEDLIEEMDNRFELLNEASANNIKIYNSVNEYLPYFVLVVDEFADLQRAFKKEFQADICILAQKARAVGIHMILATQRPSVDVITGVIKANLPSRIALKTASAVDSRVILDCNGAEKLLGKGDALINSGNLELVRFQGAFINAAETEKLCENYKRVKAFSLIDYLKGKLS